MIDKIEDALQLLYRRRSRALEDFELRECLILAFAEINILNARFDRIEKQLKEHTEMSIV